LNRNRAFGGVVQDLIRLYLATVGRAQTARAAGEKLDVQAEALRLLLRNPAASATLDEVADVLREELAAAHGCKG
jgi:hypothetical protein